MIIVLFLLGCMGEAPVPEPPPAFPVTLTKVQIGSVRVSRFEFVEGICYKVGSYETPLTCNWNPK